jgi:hypothetical protein
VERGDGDDLGKADVITVAYLGAAGRKLMRADYYRTPNPDFKGQFNILSNKASSYEKYGTKAPAESIT